MNHILLKRGQCRLQRTLKWQCVHLQHCDSIVATITGKIYVTMAKKKINL